MKLQWLGHSAFCLTESTGTSVITDPFEAAKIGYSMAYLPCDAVTLSSGKTDSLNNIVKGNPTVITKAASADVEGIKITGISSSETANSPTIYKFRLDGVTVCHLGNIKEECSADLTEDLIPVNILLLPIGGNDLTIDAEQAKEYVENILPDIVIPMHYKTKDTDLDIHKIDEFLRLFDDNQIIISNQSTLEFDRFDFDGESTKILVPKRFKG